MSDPTPEQLARAAQLCHCGHRRDVHDPCSLCECPFFRAAERVRAVQYRERTVPDPVAVHEADATEEAARVAAAEAQADYERHLAAKFAKAQKRRTRKKG
jgi:hypothetical protein